MDLIEQAPDLSTDSVKTILEQAAKMLDHLNTANEAITQKARWGIGVIVAVMATSITILGNGVVNGRIELPGYNGLECYLPGIFLIAGAFVAFVVVAMGFQRLHSGIEPRRYAWKETVSLARHRAEEINAHTPPRLDHAYIALMIVEDYQHRIAESRSTNESMATWFNGGAIFLLVGFMASVAAYATTHL